MAQAYHSRPTSVARLTLLFVLQAVTCLAAADTNSPARPAPGRNQHTHKAFTERTRERLEMVEHQIRRRDICDPNVLQAMLTVPRHAFVPDSQQPWAYQDSPLPIGSGQTISQPYIVAFMTDALAIDANSRVLEVGTGSGYQAAVCAEIAAEVYTIEIVAELAESARKRLDELGYKNVFVRAGDGYFGWPEKAPFDAVIITAAAPQVPQRLIEQLAPNGRLIMPLGGQYEVQELILVTKDARGNQKTRRLLPVRFVPMTGQIDKKEKQ